MCVHTYLPTYAQYVYIYTQTYLLKRNVCAYTHIHTQLHAMYTHIPTYMRHYTQYACIYPHTCLLTHNIYIYIYIHINIYTYTYIHTYNYIHAYSHAMCAGADNTFYAGETFKLQFTFTEEYPIESPEVYAVHECMSFTRLCMYVYVKFIFTETVLLSHLRCMPFMNTQLVLVCERMYMLRLHSQRISH